MNKDKKIWLAEYKRCSCTFIDDKKSNIPKYCPRHQNPRKYCIKILDLGAEKGYVEF